MTASRTLKPPKRGANPLGDAVALLRQGRLAEAEQRCIVLLRSRPQDTDALHLRGIVCLQTGRPGEAAEFLALSVARRPDAAAHGNLGSALAALGRHEEALAAFDRARALNPAFAEAHSNRGNSLNALGRFQEALDSCHRAIALKPDFAGAFVNRGIALQNLGRHALAAASFRKAIALAPGFADAHANLGVLLLEEGKLEESHAAIARAVELAPRRGRFYRLLAETRRLAADDPALARMEALAREPLCDDDRLELHFALGAAYDGLGRAADSFRHLLEANRLKRAQIAYDEPATHASFARIAEVFSAEALAQPDGNDSDVPVFVVGMPRSGTTLVEQILASHRDIRGAGEIPDLRNLIDRLDAPGFPAAAAALAPARRRELAARYLAGLAAHAPDARRIVDKLPDNFLRIGLIRLLLPQAKIIHVRRDPVDTCLSCFSKLFAGHLPYAYDLGELGRFYRAYETLMEHWRRVLPAGVMLDIAYEDLVGDVEGQARRLVAHCGLDWDDACLAFHRNTRAVATASAAQVRKPLYAGSVGRWHAYGEMAAPLVAALEGR